VGWGAAEGGREGRQVGCVQVWQCVCDPVAATVATAAVYWERCGRCIFAPAKKQEHTTNVHSTAYSTPPLYHGTVPLIDWLRFSAREGGNKHTPPARRRSNAWPPCPVNEMRTAISQSGQPIIIRVQPMLLGRDVSRATHAKGAHTCTDTHHGRHTHTHAHGTRTAHAQHTHRTRKQSPASKVARPLRQALGYTTCTCTYPGPSVDEVLRCLRRPFLGTCGEAQKSEQQEQGVGDKRSLTQDLRPVPPHTAKNIAALQQSYHAEPDLAENRLGGKATSDLLQTSSPGDRLGPPVTRQHHACKGTPHSPGPTRRRKSRSRSLVPTGSVPARTSVNETTD
jgi:hypothetical protein